MLKRIYLCLAAIAILLVFGSVAGGALLFSDDFEGDTVGEEPGDFEMYDHPHNSGSFNMEIEEDPEGESGDATAVQRRGEDSDRDGGDPR